MPKREKQKGLNRKITLSVTDANSHKELYSKSSSLLSLIISVLLVICSTAAITYLIVAYTPLKKTIPGYPDEDSRIRAMESRMKIDSLEREIALWAFQVGNIQRIVSGRQPLTIDSIATKAETEVSDYYKTIYASKDSILRGIVDEEEQFNISDKTVDVKQIEGLHFFSPVSGMITDGYNKAKGHPYVDVAAPAGTPVCAVLDGTVISAGWNDETGYTIEIQHDHNLVSVYKHNEQLTKKTGEKVQAGTSVAFVGGTGSLSTGVHLHFELWHNGEAIDPTLYIKF